MQLPGFVDLQVNGHMGTSFSSTELTDETFAEACRKAGIQLLGKGKQILSSVLEGAHDGSDAMGCLGLPGLELLEDEVIEWDTDAVDWTDHGQDVVTHPSDQGGYILS